MKLTARIRKAIIKATILHKGQKRKADGLPYIIHPYSVAFILSHYTDDGNIIIASLLHDALEDVSGYSENELKKEFGEKVCEVVKEVSEEKDPDDSREKKKKTWLIRKKKYLSHLNQASFEAMMISCADKIDNLRSMMQSHRKQGKKLWKKFNAPRDKKMWFYEKVLETLKERLNSDIVRELEKTWREAKRQFLRS